LGFLRREGVAFTKYDIEKNREAHKEFRKLNPTGSVPFAIINGRKLTGYSESSYRKALRAR
jgi:glutaredoxin